MLAPVVLVVPLFLAVTAILWEGVAREEARTLVAQRQTTALAGVSARLQERRQANQTIVYLLSKREGFGTFVETGNIARLAQTLIVMQATLDLSYIDVYASNGQRLLHVGETRSDRLDGSLVSNAILGTDGSALGVGDTGLVVSAAAVVSGSM
ncbi:MAG TPA: hypothetical protein VGQ62_04585, partial [Chloroflexota bacterium]|nr:hypothetical protein [Chloroflexota bacterium]